MARGSASIADLPIHSITKFRQPQGILAVIAHDDAAADCAFEEAGWHCVCDVRIDNLSQLAKQLEKAGTALPVDASSARVLLAGYRAFGEQLWPRVEGDFACAIWRPECRFLVLARDVIGARPVYYSAQGPAVRFSSELRGALALRGGDLRLEDSQVVRQLSAIAYGIFELDRTLFAGIRRVSPGTSVVFQDGSRREHRYWDPGRIEAVRAGDLREAADEMHDRIVHATLVRADVPGPVGCHLSGGLDCSSLAAILQVHRGGATPPPVFFSWTPRGAVPESATELGRIDALRNRHGFAIEYLDPVAYAAGERNPDPRLSSPLYPTETLIIEQHVQQRARQLGVRRILSGWGGDEAASHHGFGIGPDLLLRGRWFRLMRLIALHEGRWSRSKLRERGPRLYGELREAIRLRFSKREPVCLAASNLQMRHPFQPVIDPTAALSVREAQIAAYFSGHLTERIESWYCHGKRSGLYYAYPLLDRRVLEFAYALPGWCFADDKGTRRVFRTAMSRYWPAGLAERTTKSESGVAGFLMGTCSFDAAVRQSDVGKKTLLAFDTDERLSFWLDRARVQDRVKALGESPDTRNLALLSRGDRLTSLLDWVDRPIMELLAATGAKIDEPAMSLGPGPTGAGQDLAAER